MTQPIDVIITIFVPNRESLRTVKRCILSTIMRTRFPHRLILSEDNSPVGEIREFIEKIKEKFPEKDILSIYNHTNLGFIQNANRAMKLGEERSSDVVLLNNDVEVSTGWLKKMHETAYSDASIATVSPLSNNATIFSFPRIHESKEMPSRLDTEKISRIVEESGGFRPEVHSTHGFCWYTKRSVLREVGYYDENNFGTGYGEETDFCCRCSERGFIHVLEDRTYVYHKTESSFLGERAKVVKDRYAKIERMYPWFWQRVRRFEKDDPIREYREAIYNRLLIHSMTKSEQKEVKKKIKILFLNYKGGLHNGLNRYNDELKVALGNEAEIYTLSSNGKNLELHDHVGTPIYRKVLPFQLTWNKIQSDQTYKRILSFLLRALEFELVQINSIEGHTFDILGLCETFKIPMIYVVHDFEILCPTHFLINQQGAPCKVCAFGQEDSSCIIGHPHQVSGVCDGAALFSFRKKVRDSFLPRLSAIVCPSKFTQETVLSFYPELESKLHVIPHGIPSLVEVPEKKVAPQNSRLKVATIGALHHLKGLSMVKKVIARCPPDQFDFFHFGSISERIDRVKLLGPYHYKDISCLLNGEGIDVVLILSQLRETYSYTLSEVATSGIPVIVNDIGALGSRVRAERLGWVVAPNDVERTFDLLSRIRSDRSLLDSITGSEALQEQHKKMIETYRQLYSRFRNNHQRESNSINSNDLELFLRTSINSDWNFRKDQKVAELTRQVGSLESDWNCRKDQKVEELTQQVRSLESSLSYKIAIIINKRPVIKSILKGIILKPIRAFSIVRQRFV